MAEIKPDPSRRHLAAAQSKVVPVSITHYAKLVLHRWWIVVLTAVAVSGATYVYATRLPNIYTSETLILVDPQKVPETYVKSTVTGDIRNRLGTLSQQILSATRLQKIIDTFNLYAQERKTQAREDIIAKMRGDIRTVVANDFGGGGQDLQAFRISYRGRDPRVVAQVANQLATLFIDENLKAREELATGTTEFLKNQLEETRKVLQDQEAKLTAFSLKHLGEMPEQQTANLQILGQLQAQLQTVNDSLARAEQQRSITQSMMAQGTPAVVDLDSTAAPEPEEAGARPQAAGGETPLETAEGALKALLARGYTDSHPDVKRLKAQIAALQAKAPAAAAKPAAPPVPKPPAAPARKAPQPAATHFNPVLKAQLEAVDADIAKQKEEQKRLTAAVTAYRSKVEAIPIRQQQIAELQRDYEMSKTHYAQLLDKQLSAETATELEIRQKGEKFTVLDPAVPADRPSSPNRTLINGGGLLAGLALGLALALATELLGPTIIESNDVKAAVLEIIPVIETSRDRVVWRRRVIFGVASGILVLAGGALFYLLGRRQMPL
jgi:polysaccharide chain length determinant protein (PEP-CTERM system associated)